MSGTSYDVGDVAPLVGERFGLGEPLEVVGDDLEVAGGLAVERNLPRPLAHHSTTRHRGVVGAVLGGDVLRHLEGIVETETMIAFRAYSKHELEAGFELGLD